MSLSEEIDACVAAAPPTAYSQKDYYLETGAHAQLWQRQPTKDRLSEFQQFIGEIESPVSSPLAVLMDTTTLWTAKELIGGNTEVLLPTTLLDLDTFVRNVILNDRIFHLPNENLDGLAVNELIGDAVVIELPVRGLDLEPMLVDIWTEAKETLHDKLGGAKPKTAAGDDFTAIGAAWAQVLGDVLDKPLTGDELFDEHNWMHTWWSPGPQLVHQLLEITEHDGERFTYYPEHAKSFRRDVIKYVAGTNLRAFFNLLLADAIGLPYSPNLARLPYYNHLSNNMKIAEEKLRDVEVIQGALKEQLAGTRALIADAIELPVFLTAILSRISDLNRFWDELRELRDMAATYRRHRAKLLQALRNSAKGDIDKLRKAVQDETHTWRHKLGAAGGKLGSVAVLAHFSVPGAGLAPSIVTGIAAVAGLIKAGDLDPLALATIARRFRPREWFLTDVGTSARKLLDTRGKVQDLWKVKGDFREFKGRLQQLAGLSKAWQPGVMGTRSPASQELEAS